jgi:hypothetical protein
MAFTNGAWIYKNLGIFTEPTQYAALNNNGASRHVFARPLAITYKMQWNRYADSDCKNDSAWKDETQIVVVILPFLEVLLRSRLNFRIRFPDNVL